MVATSNGLLVKRPKFFVDGSRKLKLLQQSVSRKRKGSTNWLKAQQKVAKLHEYVTNCRKDWHRKLSHQLCEGVGIIFVEELNLVSLSRGMLGKHCLDAVFDQLFNVLEQTCFKRGVYFQKVDSRKTSQIYPNCQHETGKKTLAERVHKCDNCGYITVGSKNGTISTQLVSTNIPVVHPVSQASITDKTGSSNGIVQGLLLLFCSFQLCLKY